MHVLADRGPERFGGGGGGVDAPICLALCREVMRELADVHAVPVENLLAPDTVRRLAWEPPAEVTTAQVEHRLRASGARDWQVQLSAVLLAAALRESSLASAGPGGLER